MKPERSELNCASHIKEFEALGKLLNPELQSPQIQNDNETLPDLKAILGKWFGFSRSWMKFCNESYEASVHSYVSICVL